MNATKSIVFVLLVILGLGSCASNPPVRRVDSGVIVLYREDQRGVFGDPVSFRAAVLREADRIADAEGKLVIPISFKQTPVGNLGHWASIDYRFRIGTPAEVRAADKSANVSPGEKSDAIVLRFESPLDRQFKGTNEAWTYADLVAPEDFKYTVIWLKDGIVVGVTTYRAKGTAESGMKTIDWQQAPDAILEVRNR